MWRFHSSTFWVCQCLFVYLSIYFTSIRIYIYIFNFDQRKREGSNADQNNIAEENWVTEKKETLKKKWGDEIKMYIYESSLFFLFHWLFHRRSNLFDFKVLFLRWSHLLISIIYIYIKPFNINIHFLPFVSLFFAGAAMTLFFSNTLNCFSAKKILKKSKLYLSHIFLCSMDE